MNATTEQKPVLNQDNIANLARQIWQTEGCQPGRDEEYWLKAERQIMAASQLGKIQAINVGAKRKTSSANGKNSASSPAASGGANAPSLWKRASNKL